MERLAVFFPSLPLFINWCYRCLSSVGRGGSLLGCQVLPAITGLEIATNRVAFATKFFPLRQNYFVSHCEFSLKIV